ncbi:hypothetical protein ACIRBX_34035 [Kitasatospora sp. NPDC096147]
MRVEAEPEVAECPDCVAVREEEDLGPLWLPVPTAKEWKLLRKN